MNDYALGTTIYPKFSTAIAGVGTSLLGSPVVAAYADGSATEITAGITLTVDFDGAGLPGLNKIAVVATIGNGYVAGTDYALVITQGTVGGINVAGTVVCEFSLAKGAAAVQIGAAGAGLTALGDTRIANLDATISSRTKPADTQAAVTLVTTLTTYTGNTPQTGDAYARIGAAGAGLTAVAITSNVKKNQAFANFEFPMSDSTAHNPATGKTVTCTRSIDGGAFAAGTLANVAEVANGIYRVDFGAGDLDGNNIVLRATATGCDDYLERLVTQP